MIFWLFKRCEHDFKEVDTYTDYIYDLGKAISKTILYCPKCDKKKTVYTDDWKRKKKIERIKKSYKSQ